MYLASSQKHLTTPSNIFQQFSGESSAQTLLTLSYIKMEVEELIHKYDSGQSNIISIPDRRPCLWWSRRFGSNKSTKMIVWLLWGSDVIWRASNQSIFSLSWYHLPIYHQPSNQPVSLPPCLGGSSAPRGGTNTLAWPQLHWGLTLPTPMAPQSSKHHPPTKKPWDSHQGWILQVYEDMSPVYITTWYMNEIGWENCSPSRTKEW